MYNPLLITFPETLMSHHPFLLCDVRAARAQNTSVFVFNYPLPPDYRTGGLLSSIGRHAITDESPAPSSFTISHAALKLVWMAEVFVQPFEGIVLELRRPDYAMTCRICLVHFVLGRRAQQLKRRFL